MYRLKGVSLLMGFNYDGYLMSKPMSRKISSAFMLIDRLFSNNAIHLSNVLLPRLNRKINDQLVLLDAR